jgi:hypothetical protein
MPVSASDYKFTGWTVDDFQAVLFSALGVYFLVITLSDVASWMKMWEFIQSLNNTNASNAGSYQIQYLFTTVIRLIAGIWLLLGAKGLRGLLKKLRS